MTVIGFNFTSISAKRHAAPKGQIKVHRSCKPTDLEEVSLGGGSKALRYAFAFSAIYDPKVAEIEFEGSIAEVVGEEEHKLVLKTWEESKVFPPKSLERIMNAILDRCNVESILISKELGIPAPIKLPGVKIKEKDAE